MSNNEGWMWLLGGLILGGVIVAFLMKSTSTSSLTYQKAPPEPPVTQNEETWTWTDYKGNERSISVRRKVH